MSLVTKQSRIRRKSYSPLDLHPFKFLFAFLGPSFFLPLTQGELSRFHFPVISWSFLNKFASHFSSHGPQMKQKLFVNTLWNFSIPEYSRVKLTGGLKCWHVIKPLGINFLVTQNTKFAITLLQKFVLK